MRGSSPILAAPPSNAKDSCSAKIYNNGTTKKDKVK